MNLARRMSMAFVVAVSAWLLTSPAPAQQSGPPQHRNQGQSTQAASPAPGGEPLVNELSELRAKIARIEAALEMEHRQAGATPEKPAASGKRMRPSGMRMQADAAERGTGSAAGMGMGKKMSKAGMAMMGKPRMGPMGSGSAAMASALPGIPGASHIYHVGSSGFFLDHPEHVTLTTEQQAALNRIREKALLEQATAQRRIDEIEQQLWVLTGSDKPDAGKIRAKLKEVEQVRAEQRLAYIRAVGEAATVLTEQQRRRLLGLAAADSAE